MSSNTLQLKGLSRRFGNVLALDDFHLSLGVGELVALLGPSGCGKTTALRIVAGLEREDSGQVILGDRDITNVPAHQRNMGMVFQAYSLFPNLTVEENVAFGLQMRKVDKEKRLKKAHELLDLVGLDSQSKRYPHQLSGGQQQRVALARALAFQPDVLLLDEPLSALDAQVRTNLREEIRRLQLSLGTTTLFVTHDQEEAMEVADEIVIMNKGKIEQVGTTAQIYDNPASAFVIKFIGAVNVLPSQASLLKSYEFDSVSSPIFVRPHQIQILTEPQKDSTIATIQRIIYLGWEIQIGLIDGDGLEFEVHLNRHQLEELDLRVGQKVFVKALETRLFSEVA